MPGSGDIGDELTCDEDADAGILVVSHHRRAQHIAIKLRYGVRRRRRVAEVKPECVRVSGKGGKSWCSVAPQEPPSVERPGRSWVPIGLATPQHHEGKAGRINYV